jgi:Lrp/AsnC family transcriptional regulator, regulator for asnA, asnC and gidA
MLDNTAKNIIKLLKHDARTTNKKIADKLNVSEGTVRNRIKRLIDDNILKLSGLTSPDKDSNNHLVMLGISLAASKDLQNKATKIAALPGVKSVAITTGRYDLLVEVWVEVKSGLINFLSNDLAKIDGVVATESFIIMRSINKWI